MDLQRLREKAGPAPTTDHEPSRQAYFTKLSRVARRIVVEDARQAWEDGLRGQELEEAIVDSWNEP